MKYLFFDLETRKLASDLHKDNEKGWELLRQGKGGISVLAIWDSKEKWCFLYDDNHLEEIAAHLESSDVLVGWNSIGFDLPVVEGMLGRKLVLKEHIDLYALTKQALDKAHQRGRKGEYRLGSVCERTFGEKKLESGEMVTELIRKGLWARLFRYCANDVRLTRNLFNHVVVEGGIISINGTFLPLELPKYLMESRCPQ